MIGTFKAGSAVAVTTPEAFNALKAAKAFNAVGGSPKFFDILAKYPPPLQIISSLLNEKLMPFPIGAAIMGGSALAGGLANAWSTDRQNFKSRQFSREMYDKQKHDSIMFWNMQNEYNSPQAQMARYQAAGLNPHLIYGQGNSGNAGSIPTPDVSPAQFRSPEWGNAISSAGLATINAIYDLDIKQAQAKNLEAQNSVINEDAALRRAQTLAALAGTDRTKAQTEWSLFDLQFAKDLREVSADTKREILRQMRTSTDLSIEKNAREAALASSSVAEAAERMRTMREQVAKSRIERQQIGQAILNMQKDGVLKDIEIGLRRNNINPNDPLWARIVGKMLSDYFDQSGSPRSKGVWQYFWDYLK